MSKFKAMKFRVSSPEQSAALQEKLFEMGYRWGNAADKIPMNIDAAYIYTSNQGWLGWDRGDEESSAYFEIVSSQEIDTQSFIDGTYEKEDVVQNAPQQELSFREQLQQKVIEAWEKSVKDAASEGKFKMYVSSSTPKFIMDHLVNVQGLSYDGECIRWD